MTVLSVWRDARRVGVLDTLPNGDVRFTYDADVVAEARPESAVGFRSPVRAKPYTGLEAAAVFENLLPEGTLRSTLGQATKHDPSDTVGLLGAVGGECAGSLQLWPEGESPPLEPEYDDVSGSALSVAFTRASGQLRQVTGRVSLSGAQPVSARSTNFRGMGRPRRSSSNGRVRTSPVSSKPKWSGCA